MRMKDEEWDDVIDTNLGSVYRLTRLCLRGMMKARSGRIINITSVVALFLFQCPSVRVYCGYE